MERIPQMIDLAIQPTEIENVKLMPSGPSSEPYYPYGLCICLDEQTLKKLDMEDELQVGDTVHFHCLAKITSVSDDQNSGKRAEAQITAMSAEDEDEENEEEQAGVAYKAKNPYKK